ncbi:class I SAM-dependent methyltransferase [Lysobacter sp. GX 14042]|uniref:class I SAM-dependent methyltransferase n=1 Tax=Lysobacter sp. GX 14042 TaxID=2907155 RepID=UPI001F246E09|nr:class I SAM-dependent methyltransferase [Lysobacter sp. GX 14042]MCE7032696.1 class I SAM-dependent methyltransferase [Lysobacter sp. GX 14042]
MAGFARKLVRQIRIDGVAGVLAKVPLWLRGHCEARLDRRLGIATVGQVEVADSALLEPGHDHLANAVFYAPLQFAKFRRLIRAARPFDPEQYTFIDYGAGKGRALVLASGLGFRRVVGIELFDSLCRHARRNLDAVAARDPAAARIELLCMDAALYRPPAGDLFCYFYNPFDDVVMRQVLAHLEAADASAARRILIAYSNPVHAGVFDSAGFLRLHHSSDGLRIYRNRRH